MYIAVILENFSQATEDVQQGLTQDDFDMYYEIWEKYDEEATEFIPLDCLPEFVDSLEEPLRLPAPNHFKLVELDITICEGDTCHCSDILDALTKNFLGTLGDEELKDLKQFPDRKDYIPSSSTSRRQRELVCVKVVQKAWRAYVERKKGEHEGGDTAKGDPDAPGEQKELLKHTIVNIEGIPEESEEADTETGAEEDDEEDSKDKTDDGDTKSTKSTKSKKSSEEEQDKKADKRDKTSHDSGDDDDPPRGDDSRTVELYPESGVVA
jgi:hypothetical protein